MPDSVIIRGTPLREWERVARFLGLDVDQVIALSGPELLRATLVELERRQTVETRRALTLPQPRNLADEGASKSGAN